MASLTGRAANFFSKHFPGLGAMGTKRHVERYRESGGEKGSDFMGKPVFLLDVVGRSSGEPRPVMLMLIRHGDEDLVVIGSNAGNAETPNWFRNLMAAGEAHVEVGADRWPVSARELVEGPERQECWDLAVAGYPDFASYQELTDRRIPVGLLERRPG